MNSVLRIPLDATPLQVERLRALQKGFAQVCNALTPVVQRTRVWNRVALHHLAYRTLREQFPDMGSQMVCNAIYSVSRSCRMVFQTPGSPFNLERLGGGPLPLLKFSDDCPVYFDRHTLSLKPGQLSMYTLDGRIYFALTLRPEAENALRTGKLREIVLARNGSGGFELVFQLDNEAALSGDPAQTETEPESAIAQGHPSIPDYVKVEEIAP